MLHSASAPALPEPGAPSPAMNDVMSDVTAATAPAAPHTDICDSCSTSTSAMLPRPRLVSRGDSPIPPPDHAPHTSPAHTGRSPAPRRDRGCSPAFVSRGASPILLSARLTSPPPAKRQPPPRQSPVLPPAIPATSATTAESARFHSSESVDEFVIDELHKRASQNTRLFPHKHIDQDQNKVDKLSRESSNDRQTSCTYVVKDNDLCQPGKKPNDAISKENRPVCRLPPISTCQQSQPRVQTISSRLQCANRTNDRINLSDRPSLSPLRLKDKLSCKQREESDGTTCVSPKRFLTRSLSSMRDRTSGPINFIELNKQRFQSNRSKMTRSKSMICKRDRENSATSLQNADNNSEIKRSGSLKRQNSPAAKPLKPKKSPQVPPLPWKPTFIKNLNYVSPWKKSPQPLQNKNTNKIKPAVKIKPIKKKAMRNIFSYSPIYENYTSSQRGCPFQKKNKPSKNKNWSKTKPSKNKLDFLNWVVSADGPKSTLDDCEDDLVLLPDHAGAGALEGHKGQGHKGQVHKGQGQGQEVASAEPPGVRQSGLFPPRVQARARYLPHRRLLCMAVKPLNTVIQPGGLELQLKVLCHGRPQPSQPTADASPPPLTPPPPDTGEPAVPVPTTASAALGKVSTRWADL